MKKILPWILVLAFAAGAATLYFSNSSQKHELETLRGQVEQRATESAKAMAEQQILQMRQNQTAVATCINYLRQIDGAKNQWALEHQKAPDAVPLPQDIAPYFPNTQIPQCPAGGRYTLN